MTLKQHTETFPGVTVFDICSVFPLSILNILLSRLHFVNGLSFLEPSFQDKVTPDGDFLRHATDFGPGLHQGKRVMTYFTVRMDSPEPLRPSPVWKIF